MMHQKILLRSSIVLFFVSFLTYVSGQTTTSTTTTTGSTTTTTTGSTTASTTVYKKRYPYGYGSSRRNGRYGGYGDYDGYYNNTYEIGVDGIDPRRDGEDIGDFGPIYEDKPSMLSSLDLWIYSADDWEKKDTGRGRGGYDKNNYRNRNSGNDYDNRGDRNRNSDNDYDNRGDRNRNSDNDYNNRGNRDKRSSRVRFPVKRVQNYRQFPFGRFPPLISIMPWLPIFYDKLTYQTFIFSPAGGIYIIPPLINFYGQRFAVAQLIKWGYASLVSSGAPPPPNVDVAPLVHPPPAGGAVAAGVVGGPSGGPSPTFDGKKLRFNGGVKTEFPTFKPRYPQTLEGRGNRN